MTQDVIVYSIVIGANVSAGSILRRLMLSWLPNVIRLTMMRTTTQGLLLCAMLLGLMSGLVACASSSHGIVRVPRAYDSVFTAVLAAIQDAEFSVTAQEYASGTIDAEKRLPRAEGELLQMTVRLTQAPTGVTVVATVVPPAGPLATGEKPCKCHVKRFVAALETRMPEVQVVTIQ